MPLPRFLHLDAPRRQTILAAAAAELGDRGFADASYNRIIARAGISKGAMYYYFADKDDLYRTVLDAAAAMLLGQLVSIEAPDAASFWPACEAMYARCLRFFMDDPQSAALCLSVARARERQEAHPALAKMSAQMLTWMQALVRHGQSVGAVRTDVPAELMVLMGIALVEAGDRWLVLRWKDMTPDSIKSTTKMMVGLFRRVGEPEKKGKSR